MVLLVRSKRWNGELVELHGDMFPVCYGNYSDFHSEWMSILNDSELCWVMDSI